MKTGKIIVPIAVAVSMMFLHRAIIQNIFPKNESLYIGAKINVQAPETEEE